MSAAICKFFAALAIWPSMIMTDGMFGQFGRPGLDTDMHIGPVHSHLNEYYKNQKKLEHNNIFIAKVQAPMAMSALMMICTDGMAGHAMLVVTLRFNKGRLKKRDVDHEG